MRTEVEVGVMHFEDEGRGHETRLYSAGGERHELVVKNHNSIFFFSVYFVQAVFKSLVSSYLI